MNPLRIALSHDACRAGGRIGHEVGHLGAFGRVVDVRPDELDLIGLQRWYERSKVQGDELILEPEAFHGGIDHVGILADDLVGIFRIAVHDGREGRVEADLERLAGQAGVLRGDLAGVARRLRRGPGEEGQCSHNTRDDAAPTLSSHIRPLGRL